MIRKIIPLLLLVVSVAASAQETTPEKDLKKIQAAYQEREFLSFNIQYLYSYLKNPGVYVDTVNGRYKLNRSNYWVKLDDVEFIQNDSLLIAVYPDDKVILLNNSVPNWIEMIAGWEKLWQEKKEQLEASVDRSGEEGKIIMNYKADSNYKRIEIWYNKSTFLTTRMVFVVKQQLLLPEEESNEENPSDDFSIIEVRLSEYDSKPFDKVIFSATNYINQSNGKVVPSLKYSGYTILSGAANQ
jgi:hypothetical protein